MSASTDAGDHGAGGRRFLIAAGTARYDHLPEDQQLPGVRPDVKQIVDLLTGEHGYERVLDHLGDSPDCATLREDLEEWLQLAELRPDDILAVYYAGHGDVGPDGRHYLLARDSKWGKVISRALATEDLARMIASSAAGDVLIMLDTCWSGQGGLDVAGLAKHVASGLERPRAVQVIAAARPRQRAADGGFAAALVHAVREPSVPDVYQPFLGDGPLLGDVNGILGQREFPQQARGMFLGYEGPPRFFRNPRYRPDAAPGGIDLETLRRMVQADVDVHFHPRARGVEYAGDRGSYFTGRTVVLRELAAWLAQPEADGRVRVVTGRPGSGKSAVLSRLIMLSRDAEYRERGLNDGVPHDTVPPEGSIDLPIHARERSLEDVVGAIAAEAGVQASGPDELVSALASRGEPFTVALDALDEAKDPEPIARRVLAPLGTLPSVRLLVGTREHLVAPFGRRARVIDLDLPEHIDRQDVATYATRRLLAADDPTSPTPYRGLHAQAAEVAGEVAERACPVFLVARLLCEYLVHAPDPVDTTEPGWRASIPVAETVADAFAAYLRRFGPAERRVRDLLTPLAYAAGAGLPWENIWAPVASAISGCEYHDGDIAWLCEHAAAFIVTDMECDRTVYRLYHEALAETLRRPGQAREIHRRITEALVATVPQEQRP